MTQRPDDGWDRHLGRHPEATLYHSRIWARILAASFPKLRDESRWIDLGGERVALPLYAWPQLGGLAVTLHSSFPFLYGGPIPSSIDGRDLTSEALESLAGGRRSIAFVGNPLGPSLPGRPVVAVRAYSDATHILDLPGDFETYWTETLPPRRRNDVRRLGKQGVVVRIGGTEEEVAHVYGLYRRSFRRWGGRPSFIYPEAFYQAMIRLGEGSVRLYLAEWEGSILGGAFVTRWNRHAHYHAGYFDHASRAYRPNVLIQVEAIRDAIAEGCRGYDFLPSGGNRGVEAFKEGLGGHRISFPRHEYRHVIQGLLDRLRRIKVS